MATRVLNRRAMRKSTDQAEQADPTSLVVEGVKKPRTRKLAAEKPLKEKAAPKPRVRKRAVKVTPRMFACWAVCDNGMKRVAVFEYRDRTEADAKLVELQERKPGAYFLQLVKVAYDPPAAIPVAAD